MWQFSSDTTYIFYPSEPCGLEGARLENKVKRSDLIFFIGIGSEQTFFGGEWGLSQIFIGGEGGGHCRCARHLLQHRVQCGGGKLWHNCALLLNS